MTESSPYSVTFTPSARRQMDKLPLDIAVALFEHLIGPVAGNPTGSASHLKSLATAYGQHGAATTARFA